MVEPCNVSRNVAFDTDKSDEVYSLTAATAAEQAIKIHELELNRVEALPVTLHGDAPHADEPFKMLMNQEEEEEFGAFNLGSYKKDNEKRVSLARFNFKTFPFYAASCRRSVPDLLLLQSRQACCTASRRFRVSDLLLLQSRQARCEEECRGWEPYLWGNFNLGIGDPRAVLRAHGDSGPDGDFKSLQRSDVVFLAQAFHLEKQKSCFHMVADLGFLSEGST